MKNWFVASYKINEIDFVTRNLFNQDHQYYLPKITVKKTNATPKEDILFPGYIFINANLDMYSSIKYTKGIKNIIQFGNYVPLITDKEIKGIRNLEEQSKLAPLDSIIKIGQEAVIKNGSLKGSIVKICSLSSKERVNVLIHILGSERMIRIPKTQLIV